MRHLWLQEVNTEERVAPLSPSKSSGDLLSITSSKGGLKAEVATILGAQQFFHESGAPKRSASVLLINDARTPRHPAQCAKPKRQHCTRCQCIASQHITSHSDHQLDV